MKNKHSLRYHIWFSFLMISGVFACIVLGTTFYLFSDFYAQQMTADAKNQTQRMSIMMDNYITELRTLQNSMIYSQYEDEYLIARLVEEENGENEVTDYERLLNYRQFISLVRNNTLNNRYADGAYLICKSGQLFSSVTQEIFLEKQYLDSDWYEEVISNGASQKEFLYYDPISKSKKILVCKRVMGVDGDSQGIFILVGNLSEIEGLCGQYENEYYDLMDKNGDYIFRSIPEEEFGKLREKAEKKSDRGAKESTMDNLLRPPDRYTSSDVSEKLLGGFTLDSVSAGFFSLFYEIVRSEIYNAYYESGNGNAQGTQRRIFGRTAG